MSKYYYYYCTYKYCIKQILFVSCRKSESSQRPDKAQCGAQTLLDLFCGCQGEFRLKKKNTLNVLTVCCGGFSVGPNRDFTGRVLEKIPATISQSNGAGQVYGCDMKC